MPAMPHLFGSRSRAGRAALPSALVAASFVLLAGSALAAQDARPATEAPRGAEVAELEHQQVLRAAGDLLARTTLRRSRNLARPTITDYRLTALGLNLARRASPEDAELLRHEIEAWTAADDAPRLIAATRELVRLDPRDTIAQLRLIDTQIGRLNTVEERREAYDRLLATGGRGLRATIRSRLALDAALLAREDGDEAAFLRLLTDATLLDSTNKNAAALYASMLLGLVETPLERFELIANVLQSDPLDIGAYENAAIELMSRGAYAGAQRYLDRMRDLLSASGRDFMSRPFLTQPNLYDQNRVNDYLITTWQTKGSREMLSFIADAQGSLEARFIAEIRSMRERGFTEAQMQQTLGQRGFPFLVHQLELFRLLALVSQPEQEAATMAFTQRPIKRDEFLADLNPYNLDGFIEPPAPTEQMLEDLRLRYPEAPSTHIERIAAQQARSSREVNPIHEAATRYLLSTRELVARVEQSDEVDPSTKRLIAVNTALESIWMLLAAELSVDLAERRLDSLLEQLAQDSIEPEAIQRYRGWIACNRGEFETARELLSPLLDGDATAIYALAMTELRSGNNDQAVELLDRLRFEFPQTVLACLARDRIAVITGQKPPTPQWIGELNDYALSFAPWIERLTRSPREFMSLTVRPASSSLGPLDRLELVLQLRNTSGRPLAVGPNSPINSRFLLTPRIEIEGQEYTRLIRDLLLERVRREMRLEPGAPLPQEFKAQVESLVQQQVLAAGRRLLEVVDADRVLRLDPNEAVTIPIWVGRGNVGELIDRDLTERVSVQWSVAQGFVQAPRATGADEPTQSFTAGPMSMTTGTSRQSRLKLVQVSPVVLGERMRQGDGAELARTLLHATSLLSRPTGAAFGAEADADRGEGARLLRGALIEIIPTLSDAHLALLLMRLNELDVLATDDDLHGRLRTAVTSRLRNTADADSTDLQLLIAAGVVSLTRAADDPLLRLAMESSDADLREFALVLAQILRERGFVTGTPESPLDPSADAPDPFLDIDGDLLQVPAEE